MKVYVVEIGFYSDRSLVGIFSTLEKAQAACTATGEHEWQEMERHHSSERAWFCRAAIHRSRSWAGECDYYIEERVLDEPDTEAAE